MKVCHFSKNFSSQNKLILKIQSSIELSQIQGILSNYSEVFLFFAKYGFLFENDSLETESSKSKHAPVESTLSTQDPARDGNNWYGYCGQNPVMFQDPSGLFYYTGSGQQSSSTPATSNGSGSINPNNQGNSGSQGHLQGQNQQQEKNNSAQPSHIKTTPTNGEKSGQRKLKKGATVAEQLQYLKDIVNDNYSTPQERANAAKALRDEMRNSGENNFDLDGLLLGSDGDEIFINETLRDFLNTSDNGNDYKESDMKSNGWRKVKPSAAKCHQYGMSKKGPKNIKYVNADGREAVFSPEGELLKGDNMNKGTFNYARGTDGITDWTASSEHGRWDMEPFFRQYSVFPIYRTYIPNFNNYGANSK